MLSALFFRHWLAKVFRFPPLNVPALPSFTYVTQSNLISCAKQPIIHGLLLFRKTIKPTQQAAMVGSSRCPEFSSVCQNLLSVLPLLNPSAPAPFLRRRYLPSTPFSPFTRPLPYPLPLKPVFGAFPVEIRPLAPVGLTLQLLRMGKSHLASCV